MWTEKENREDGKRREGGIGKSKWRRKESAQATVNYIHNTHQLYIKLVV